MKILDRYIAKTMAFYTLGVMLVWLSIYALFNFIEEIKFIGQQDYTITAATKYVLLDLPSVMYSHSSVVILLGSLLALGHLASTSQLIVIRGSGVSIAQVTKLVVKTALIFLFLVAFVGELVAPVTTKYAESSRSSALGGVSVSKNQQGFWVKDKGVFINVKKNFNGKIFEEVTLVRPKNTKALSQIEFSNKALLLSDKLQLNKPSIFMFSKNKDNFTVIERHNPIKSNTNVSFNQSLIDSLKSNPHELSTWSLYKQISFLGDNSLAADNFEVELYKRLVKPLSLAAMVVFSMIFVFGSLRDASLGKKIFLGLVVSLFFELTSRIGGVLSLRLDYNHLLVALIPPLIALFIAVVLLKRKSLS